MAETTATSAYPPLPPLTKWLPVLLLGWILPGGGYFLLGRRVRGAITAAAVVIPFTLGLMLRGYMFQPIKADLLTTLIYTGGWVSDLAVGLPYLLAKWFGYDAPDIAGFSVDYGTKFLVAAGLMNILALTDTWEIAVGRKE